MKKNKVSFYLEKDVEIEIVRFVRGYRGLSSKNKRIRDKKIKQVIPDILTMYLNGLLNEQ